MQWNHICDPEHGGVLVDVHFLPAILLEWEEVLFFLDVGVEYTFLKKTCCFIYTSSNSIQQKSCGWFARPRTLPQGCGDGSCRFCTLSPVLLLNKSWVHVVRREHLPVAWCRVSHTVLQSNASISEILTVVSQRTYFMAKKFGDWIK